MCSIKHCFSLIIVLHITQINSQSGPDPWNYELKPLEFNDELNIPPDIRMPINRNVRSENKLEKGEWFFRRVLAIILKGGQSKVEEDSIDISLQMKFDTKQWDTLNKCLESDSPLSEDMLRKAIGYVQDSIYKPTITEKIIMAWSDYIQFYLTEYKTHITYTLCLLAALGGLVWLWKYMSHKAIIIIVFLISYGYEAIISYKEAEQKEYENFISAMSRCKWAFWRSSCEIPPADPLVFLKHMNPLKIAMRMFTTALAEPMVAITATIKILLHDVTDGLWYPFNRIVYAILIGTIIISLIYFFIMILFNWLLNIPFHLGFGLFGISIKQRNRTLFTNNTATQETTRVEEAPRTNIARIEALLDKMVNLNILTLSNNLHNNTSNAIPKLTSSSNVRAENNMPSIKRSASTGRLPNLTFSSASDNIVRRNVAHDGSGDAR